MEFNPTHYNKSRSKFYSMDHDKFLVYASHLEGYGNWDKIRRKIKEESLFRFDHFIKYIFTIEMFLIVYLGQELSPTLIRECNPYLRFSKRRKRQ